MKRRDFLRSSTALAAISMVPLNSVFLNAAQSGKQNKPNSNFGGVQVGTITYSWRSLPSGATAIIQYCIQSGISSIELMSNDVEEFAGAPKNPVSFGPPPGAKAGGPPPGMKPGAMPPRPKLTPEQETALAKYKEDIRAWRIAAPMAKFEELRKLFDEAGVTVHIVKFSPADWSDEEIDYSFKVAKILGAKGVSNEIGDAACKRLAPFAEKHQMYAIFHQHMQPAEPGWTFDKFLAYSPNIMLNFDAGHYFGSTGLHPNGIIERLHDRIISIHIKDKTGPKSTPPNTNQVWGKGEMPIAEVLKLIQKNKWPIFCDIELEYEVPEGSDAVKEVAKCLEFTKKILV